MKISKLVYAWEQFKAESEKAARMSSEDGKPCHLVFIPTLKQFDATCTPHEGDEIITTYGDPSSIYSPQDAILPDIITAFDVWCQYNGHKL